MQTDAVSILKARFSELRRWDWQILAMFWFTARGAPAAEAWKQQAGHSAEERYWHYRALPDS